MLVIQVDLDSYQSFDGQALPPGVIKVEGVPKQMMGSELEIRAVKTAKDVSSQAAKGFTLGNALLMFLF